MADLMKQSLSQAEGMIRTMMRFNEMSVDLMNRMMTDSLKFWQKQPCPCDSAQSEQLRRLPNDARVICPPQDNCPPGCLLTIIRHANLGETTIVPFKVRNASNYPKTYMLGVRALTDEHGQQVDQPSLDKIEIEVQPGMAVMAEMKLYINENFKPGSLYETEIVIRESRHNQNICFKLYVDPISDVPEAVPYDENDIDTHFHRWYYHYYCTPPDKRNLKMADLKEGLVAEAGKSQIVQSDQPPKSQTDDAGKYIKSKAKALYTSRKSKPKS